jgi:nitrogen PTS system EIIA component
MKLTAREAARLLAVGETEIYRWVGAGSIPCYLVNHQPRFARTELLEWATSRRMPVSPELFHSDEGEERAPPLAEALARGGIQRGVGGATREQVLRGAVERLPGLDGGDRALLAALLLARESAGSVGIGEGIAIPHVRSPIVCPGGLAAITLCFLETPLDFRAADGQPVSTLFLIVSATIPTHLQLLAKLSLALLDGSFKAAVAGRAADAEILAQARRVEARLLPEAAAPEGGP